MGHVEIARAWFESHVPPAIWKRIVPESLTLTNGQFGSPQERHLRSDLVYRATMTDGETIYLYVLVEHQSTPDRFMALRLLEYALAILRQDREQGGEYPPIVVPFCVYYGEVSPYPFSTEIWDCFKDRDLAKAIMFSAFGLFDLTTVTSEALKSDGLASFFQYLLKCNGEPLPIRFLREAQLAQLVLVLSQLGNGQAYVRSAMKYIFNAVSSRGKGGPDDDPMLLLTEIVPDDMRGEAMTFADQLRQEGIKEGIHKGKLEGIQEGKLEGKLEGQETIATTLLKRGFLVDEVQSLTGLPPERLEQLLKRESGL